MSAAPPDHFATTRWSLVRAASRPEGPESAAALEELCRSYWYPVFGYIRRRVPQAVDAQDLTQDFFCRLLEKNVVHQANEDRGRFRAFLLTAVRNFLSNARDKAQAAKRGGQATVLSLDFESAESRWSLEPADNRTPESCFEREWALALLDRVLDRLRQEARRGDREKQFDVLQKFLVGSPPDSSFAQAAAELGISADAARQSVHRMRGRYRALLRDEVAQTLESPADVDDELQRLMASLAS